MRSWDELYFGLLGISLAITGAIELFVGIAGTNVSIAFVSVGGTYLLWRGVIVFSAGTFFIKAAVNGLDTRRNQGIAILAAIMVWIVAGTEVLARVLGAIPGGSDVWVASANQIVRSIAPPYSPSIVFALLALVVVRYAVDTSGGTGGGVGE